MMRALYTAASGMLSQQTNVDTISNNLSNISTTGYKKEVAEFKSLLYQTLQDKTTDSQGNPKPVSGQVGLGVKNSAITSRFDQGALTATGGAYDFAIQGNGFFTVQKPDGTIAYTKNGSFQTSLVDGGVALADSEGNRLVDTNGNPIVIGTNYNVGKLTIDENGNVGFPGANNVVQNTNIQIGLVQFSNPAGLEKTSGSLYKETAASGEPRPEATDTTLQRSSVKQGYLEASNVQAVDEMVSLIVAQRAYEMNSKAIAAADTMLQQANNLRG